MSHLTFEGPDQAGVFKARSMKCDCDIISSDMEVLSPVHISIAFIEQKKPGQHCWFYFLGNKLVVREFLTKPRCGIYHLLKNPAVFQKAPDCWPADSYQCLFSALLVEIRSLILALFFLTELKRK